MQGRMIVQFSKIMIPIVSLSFHIMSYGVAVYIPQTLKDCVNVVHEVAAKTDNTTNLAELYSIIRTNRVLASDSVVRSAVKELFSVIKNNDTLFWHQEHNRAVKKYLSEYLNSLHDVSVLLAMNGDKSQVASWPMSLVTRSLNKSLVARDMICLSSELTQNLQLSGNVDINFSSQYSLAARAKTNALNSGKLSHLKDIDVDMGVDIDIDMATDFICDTPTIIFGTGVASPLVNAWRMSPSDFTQNPIMMQFAIPKYLNPKKSVTLELHFLVKQHAAPDGTARIRVDGTYMHVDAYGDITNSDSYVIDSNDFLVTEQLGTTNSLRHICVKIRVEKATFKKCNSALLALTRIAPTTGSEYEQDLYLAAAVLRYTV